MDHGYDEIRGGGDVAELRPAFEKPAGERGEALFVHVGFGGDHADEAANQLDIRIQLAFETGADEADFREGAVAQVLFVNVPVLPFRKAARSDDHA